jgi:hypothetical protein
VGVNCQANPNLDYNAYRRVFIDALSVDYKSKEEQRSDIGLSYAFDQIENYCDRVGFKSLDISHLEDGVREGDMIATCRVKYGSVWPRINRRVPEVVWKP